MGAPALRAGPAQTGKGTDVTLASLSHNCTKRSCNLSKDCVLMCILARYVDGSRLKLCRPGADAP